MKFRTLEEITTLPPPFDRELATVRRERWLAACDTDPDLRESSHELARDSTGGALLDAVFGNSPYLARCLVRHPAILPVWAADGPDAAMARAVGSLEAHDSEGSVMRRLRHARAMSAAAVALGDISGLWSWREVTAGLSRFADTACRTAVDHLLARFGPRREEPSRECGFIVLGLGKLGGGELNYSSDIDLIVLWDDERFGRFGPDPLAVALRLTRRFVKMLQEQTADGFVLRTDLRLRPDPLATPLAMSVDSAELYYESVGQNWERSAMIKARPVAGDLDAGGRFLERLRPFVWRRHLDFEAIGDIHSIRRRIHEARGTGAIRAAGHNLKLGRGGIREIEFLAQARQLVFGGRNSRLRRRATCDALDALCRAELIDAAARDDLVHAYGELRRVEHRLQMIDNAQTHDVPATGRGLEHIATFLGHSGRGAFERHVEGLLATTESHYEGFFGNGGDGPPPHSAGESGLEGLLQRSGFTQRAGIAHFVGTWRDGTVRALAHERSRELVHRLLPRILAALSATGDGDAAFFNLHAFLGRLPAGVRFLSLLDRHPALLDLVAGIMATAPRLANALGASPALLDYALARDFGTPLPDRERLEDDLAEILDEAEHEEDLLDRVRRWYHDREFRLAVALMRGTADPRQVSHGLSDMCDAVIRQLLRRIGTLFEARHGPLAGSGIAIVAAGRYGMREPAFGPRLDLVIVHHHDRPDLKSCGARPLGAQAWTSRLVQRLLAALTVTTNAGALFDISLALVSEGRTSNLERLAAGEAQDLLALAGARVVAASGGLGERAQTALADALATPVEPARLVDAILDRRQRLAGPLGEAAALDAEHGEGGLIDLDLVTRYMERCGRGPAPEGLGEARALLHAVRTVNEGLLGEPVPQVPRGCVRLLATVTGSRDPEELKSRVMCSRNAVRRALARVAQQGTAARETAP